MDCYPPGAYEAMKKNEEDQAQYLALVKSRIEQLTECAKNGEKVSYNNGRIIIDCCPAALVEEWLPASIMRESLFLWLKGDIKKSAEVSRHEFTCALIKCAEFLAKCDQENS